MKTTARILIACMASISLLIQLAPWKYTTENMFKTQEEILTSYGAPINFLTLQSVRIFKTGKTNQLGSAHSFGALAIDIGLIAVAGLILWLILKGGTHPRRRIAVSCILIFLIAGLIISMARAPWLRTKARMAHRAEFARNAIKCVNSWSGDKDWIESQKTVLKEGKGEDFLSARITRNFMLLKNGDWLVFCQGVHKTDNTIDDILIMRGSDGKWYFTDAHICVNMFQFIMYDAPSENLKAVVNEKDFALEPFADENELFNRACLYRGWR